MSAQVIVQVLHSPATLRTFFSMISKESAVMKTGNALSSAITHISCIALCLVLTLALLLASAAAETETRIPDREYFTVGIDIMAEDISEVYYTYASST